MTFANNSIIDEPLGPAIEQLTQEIVSDVVKSRLLEEEANRSPTSALSSNTDINVFGPDVSNEIGRIIDDKLEDKRAAINLEMEQKIKREVKAEAEKRTNNPGSSFSSFGGRRRMLADVQKEASPSKEQFDRLSGNVDSIKRDQDAMKKGTDANTQALQEMQGRVQNLENSPPSSQVAIPDAVTTPSPCAAEPAAAVVGCDHKEVDDLITKTDGHEKRIESIENVFTHIKPEDLWNFIIFATAKFDEFDGYFSELQNKVQEIDNTQKRQADLLDDTVSKQKASSEQQQTQQKCTSDKDISDLKDQNAAKDKQIADLKAQNNKLAEDSAQQGRRIESLEAGNKQLAEANAEQGREIESIKANAAAQKAERDAEQKVQNDRLDSLEQWRESLAGMFQQFPGPNQQQPQLVPQQPSPPAPQGNGPWTPAGTPPNQAPDPVPELDVEMENGGNGDDADDGLDSEMMDAPDQPEQPQVPQPPQQSQQPQPPRQLFHQPQQPSTSTPRDTPMANAGPIFPASNGNVGAAQQPQPMAGSQPFPSNGPIIPAPTTPSGSAPQPSRQHLGPLLPQPPSSGSVPSQPAASTPAPAPAAPAAPTPAGPASQKGNLFAKSLFSSGSHNVNPNQFNFNTAAPAFNMPQIDWDAKAGKLKVDFDPPSDLDDDDDELLNPKGQMPQAAAAPATPSTGQTATKISSPGNTGASSAAPVNGGSGSNAPAPPVANNAGPSSSAAGSSSTPAKPTPKPAKKKPSPFIQRKPAAATPSKPAEVTSKAQSTMTPAAAIAAARQAAFKELYNAPAAPQTPSPAPVAPLQPAGGESGLFIPGAPNNSPFALKVKPPAFQPSSSPYLSQSRSHDTVESSSPVNLFLKEVVVVPEVKPATTEAGAAEAGTAEPAKLEDNGDDIDMSDSDSKPKAPEAPAATMPEGTDNDATMSDPQSEPATTEAPKPEPSKPEATKAPTAPVARKADAMDVDRKLVKPKGRFQNMTRAQVQAHKERFNKEVEWAAQDRKANAPAPKKPAGSEEDEVDYADPNDMNDEDTHTTVMVAPKKSVKPAKYTPLYFQKWKKSFCYSTYPTWNRPFVHLFCQQLAKMEQHDYCLDELVEKAGFPRQKKAYEKSQMMRLMDFWFEEVFMGALRDIRCEAGVMDSFRREFNKPNDPKDNKPNNPVEKYFALFPADTI